MRILPSELPPDASELMGDLLAEDPVPVHQLRVELAEHLAQLTAHASKQEFIDLDTATLLNSICHKLLDRLGASRPGQRLEDRQNIRGIRHTVCAE